MRLIDSHCHLQDPKFDPDRAEVIRRAFEQIDGIVVIGDDLPNSRAAIALCAERVFATVAFHPYHAGQVTDETLAELRTLARSPGVVAIGEIGLDYFNEFEPRAIQKEAFTRQLGLALELSLPVAIHNRNADADTLALLEPWMGRLPGVLMHCFGSDAPFARRCIEMGMYISFAGNVTYPKAQPLRDAAAVVPLKRLMVETDAPYLAPQPVRGKRCEPAFVTHTAHALAALKGVPFDVLAGHTAQNTRAFYRLP